ncbi:SinI family restriction endonuclease [Facklamia sp. P12950]|uniref:SinI family restriction endonuclease n=1 Tax=Facklamia sp. P12950 TaxID=3421951 RepID=UPI003D166E7A
MAQQTYVKTMKDKNITIEEAKEGFKKAKDYIKTEYSRSNYQIKEYWLDSIDQLFEYAIKYNPELFVSLHHASEDYFKKWIRRFLNERLQPATEKKLKTYMELDSALTARVDKVTRASDEDLKKYIYGHAIYMSAENFNGAILEEYLSTILEPIGWIWCSGSVYRAIDFCLLDYDDNENNSVMLQVKNKYNTENSSSSAIRSGTTIIKWNRLNRPDSTDLSKPIPNWENLKQLVLAHTNITDKITEQKINLAVKELNEDSYLKYIHENSTTEVESL